MVFVNGHGICAVALHNYLCYHISMWRLWAIIGFAVWILIVSLALNPGTTRTLLTQLSALAIVVLSLWRLSADHVYMSNQEGVVRTAPTSEVKEATSSTPAPEVQA